MNITDSYSKQAALDVFQTAIYAYIITLITHQSNSNTKKIKDVHFPCKRKTKIALSSFDILFLLVN